MTASPRFDNAGSEGRREGHLEPTVAGLGDSAFDVQISPYTWEHTALRHLQPDDKVNLECDMIGKYVVGALEARKP